MSDRPRSILEVARELGLAEEDVELFGRGKAKLELSALARPPRGKGRLVLVSAINPTAAGEGKTTMSIALAMGMRRLGKNAVLALREPSLGPVFGVKGGGTGGGRASLVPADDINLHFTGDGHAVTTAHNLLSALVDNAIYFRDEVTTEASPPSARRAARGTPESLAPPAGGAMIDPRQVTWGRALDMNDRFLRRCVIGMGGRAHGVPREERFDITAASEIMAILALATSHEDLERRLARIVVGMTYDGRPVTAGAIGAAGAMTAVLRDALKPNLVQTAEGGPAIVHAGPFGNIAHGCNSILATQVAMRSGDYAITEAGFGFDLGGQKFLDIKCRLAGIWPRAVVLVATLRALKVHGGAPVKRAGEPDAARLEKGLAHLEKHVESVRAYGLAPIVAINVFPSDTNEELAMVERAAAQLGVRVARCEGFARGGDGAIALAELVCEAVDVTDEDPPAPKYAYEATDPPEEKMRKIARSVYGATDVNVTDRAQASLRRIRELGYEGLPVCMAKTPHSLSDEPSRVGRPRDFWITVRDVRLSAGAGFLVPLTGEVLTMPGLPRIPAARHVRLSQDGRITGLMQNE